MCNSTTAAVPARTAAALFATNAIQQYTPYDATLQALYQHALTCPIHLAAQCCEAIRLLVERQGEAQRLFDIDSGQVEAATPAQLQYLKVLGHRGEVRNKRHAGELIQSLKARRGNV